MWALWSTKLTLEQCFIRVVRPPPPTHCHCTSVSYRRRYLLPLGADTVLPLAGTVVKDSLFTPSQGNKAGNVRLSGTLRRTV
jgi:hypothetical protein